MYRLPLSTLVLGLALLAAPAAAQQAAPLPIDPKWMLVEAGARRVSFEIIAGHTPFNGGLNFNGFRDGELTFIVPAGWTVTMGFVNQDRNLPHSVQIIPDSQPLPVRGVDPVIPGAATKDADMGTTSGSPKERFRFTAERPGSYVIFCAVAGHGLGGMWARLKVDSAATAPAILVTPKPATR